MRCAKSAVAVREINEVTSNIAGAVGQQDAATREISANAQMAAQGNETLVTNIGSLSEAIGETNKAADIRAFGLKRADLDRRNAVARGRAFFHNLRADPLESQHGDARRIAAAG